MSIELATKRPISKKGQICIPSEYREGVEAYVVKESTDEQGRECLKLYPIEREDSDDE